MRITVQLFAVLREATGGVRQVDLEVPAETTARQVAQILAECFPKFGAHLSTLSFAVDGEIVSADAKVVNAGEIALLPPVSGG